MSALLCGSREHDDPAAIGSFLDLARPSLVIHGAAGLDADEPFDDAKLQGADGHAHREAQKRGIQVDPHPAAWKRLKRQAGMIRNAEMSALTFHVAASWIVGKVGSDLTPGSADMVQRCRDGVWRGRGKDKKCIIQPRPTVICRDNGVEPCRDVAEALWMLRALFYDCGREAALRAPGQALVASLEGRTTQEEVLTALACARETSRFAAWLEAVEGAVRAA